MHFYLLVKLNDSHIDDDNIEENRNHKDNIVNRKKEIDLLKKESKLSIDDVLDQLPKGYLESRTNDEIEEEVCFLFIEVL